MGLTFPNIRPSHTGAVTDTGAQSNLLGLKVFHQLGLKKHDLVGVKNRLRAINQEEINILGAVFLRISGNDPVTGDTIETAIMAYVSDSTSRFYISKQAMEQLGIIGSDFPRVGSATIGGVQNTPAPLQGLAPCGCPTHKKPPPHPDRLPFPATEENIPKMRQWLLDRYASSTFNRCPHQRLPLMDVPPIAIHIDPDATPTVVHTAATVPLQWRDEVKTQLDEDVALGVLSKVPPKIMATET